MRKGSNLWFPFETISPTSKSINPMCPYKLFMNGDVVFALTKKIINFLVSKLKTSHKSSHEKKNLLEIY